MPLMAEGRVLPYLDIPFQHASPTVLKRMRRPAHAENTLARIQAWRREVPELVVRSSFIVGFPGETDAEFEELLEWIDEAQLDRVGCFRYSPVAGAPANDAGVHVEPEVMNERYERFMERAAKISAERLTRFVGRRMQVLVDSVSEGKAIARTMGDAPEIDGVVEIRAARGLKAGEFADVIIESAGIYDLAARPAT
jgi:ribosomal protein S12 methylthiotransferase